MDPERSGESSEGGDENREGGADAVAVLYILGGIPAIVAFCVILFTLVRFFPKIPA